MSFKANKIVLDGLQVYPSNNYEAGITGVFDHERITEVSELMTDGAIAGSSKITSKTINIMVGITRKNFRDYLMLNQIFSRENIKLQLEYDDIGVIETNIRVESKADSDESNAISVIAKADDPRLYKSNWTEIELAVIKTGGIFIGKQMNKFPIVFNTTVSGNKGEINNDGMYPTWSVVEIKGPCSDIDILNETTNERMRINVELSDSDILTIDSRESTRGIYLNDIPNIELKNGDWLSVPSGKSTWIFNRVSNSDNNSRHCKIKFREVYM